MHFWAWNDKKSTVVETWDKLTALPKPLAGFRERAPENKQEKDKWENGKSKRKKRRGTEEGNFRTSSMGSRGTNSQV